MRRYGCFNRADYLPSYPALDGWVKVWSGNTVVARMKDIEFTASPGCNYTITGLGRVDPRCEGCAGKAVEK